MQTNLNRLDEITSRFVDEENANLFDIIQKEILHYDILDNLQKSNMFSSLVFQGGTALRLCYNGDRYSEDLDFVLRENLEFDSSLMKDFENIFLKNIADMYGLEASIVLPKDNSNLVQKWSAKIFLPQRTRKNQIINIEIAKIPSYSHGNKSITNHYLTKHSIILNVESLEEILADKIIAFAERKYLKYRDIWDIKFLRDTNVKINLDLVNKKISNYHIEDFEEKLISKLVQFHGKDSEFYAEMSRFLPFEKYQTIKQIQFYADILQSITEVVDKVVNKEDETYKASSRLSTMIDQHLSKTTQSDSLQTLKHHRKR